MYFSRFFATCSERARNALRTNTQTLSFFSFHRSGFPPLMGRVREGFPRTNSERHHVPVPGKAAHNAPSTAHVAVYLHGFGV